MSLVLLLVTPAWGNVAVKEEPNLLGEGEENGSGLGSGDETSIEGMQKLPLLCKKKRCIIIILI